MLLEKALFSHTILTFGEPEMVRMEGKCEDMYSYDVCWRYARQICMIMSLHANDIDPLLGTKNA